jgi:hypothetical protein
MNFGSLAKWNGARSGGAGVPYSATKTQWDWRNQYGEQSMELKWNSTIAASSVVVHCRLPSGQCSQVDLLQHHSV